jgi:hypothetical protein
MNAVGEQITLLQQMMQQAQEYEEEAMGVQSNSKASADTKNSKSDCKRSNSPDGNRHRGRSKSRNGNRECNKCPHCKAYRCYASNKYHDEKKCYYNKQWK